MKHAILCLAVIFVATLMPACAVESTGTTTQVVCTEEDQQNGTCGDPGGGGIPDVVLQQEAVDYGVSAAASMGATPVAMSGYECHAIGGTALKICNVSFDFGSWRIAAWCYTEVGVEGDAVFCGASICTPTGSGEQCQRL